MEKIAYNKEIAHNIYGRNPLRGYTELYRSERFPAHLAKKAIDSCEFERLESQKQNEFSYRYMSIEGSPIFTVFLMFAGTDGVDQRCVYGAVNFLLDSADVNELFREGLYECLETLAKVAWHCYYEEGLQISSVPEFPTSAIAELCDMDQGTVHPIFSADSEKTILHADTKAAMIATAAYCELSSTSQAFFVCDKSVQLLWEFMLSIPLRLRSSFSFITSVKGCAATKGVNICLVSPESMTKIISTRYKGCANTNIYRYNCTRAQFDLSEDNKAVSKAKEVLSTMEHLPCASLFKPLIFSEIRSWKDWFDLCQNVRQGNGVRVLMNYFDQITLCERVRWAKLSREQLAQLATAAKKENYKDLQKLCERMEKESGGKHSPYNGGRASYEGSTRVRQNVSYHPPHSHDEQETPYNQAVNEDSGAHSAFSDDDSDSRNLIPIKENGSFLSWLKPKGKKKGLYQPGRRGMEGENSDYEDRETRSSNSRVPKILHTVGGIVISVLVVALVIAFVALLLESFATAEGTAVRQIRITINLASAKALLIKAALFVISILLAYGLGYMHGKRKK